MLAKRALLRKVGEHNADTEVAELEKELLQKINNLGIGPMGYGGRTTALAVNVEVFPSHIAVCRWRLISIVIVPDTRRQ